MTKKYLLILLFLFILPSQAFADFNFNATCVEAYQDILALRFTDARTLIQREKQRDPQNGVIVLLENYSDYFGLLSSDNKNEYEKKKDLKSDRISALEKNDENSPYYLYCQAEIYLQWGLLKGKFGDYTSSAFDVKKANSLLKDNAKKCPDFLPNQKCQALINVIFGAIPPNLKGVTRFLGMSGNTQAGIKQLESLQQALPKSRFSFYKDEVIFLFCYIDIDILHNKGNYNKLMGYLDDMESKSLLKIYLQGYVAAKTAHNEEAIAFLQYNPASNQYAELPAINYLLGNAKLNRMDADADDFLLKYIKDYRGINFIKDTYLKLAYFNLLHNDIDRYNSYLKMVRNAGYASEEKDKQALKEANDARPDIDLLKARLYFDGGYYTKALNQIKNKDINDLKLVRDKTELTYRLGRIYEMTNQPDEALVNYQKAINSGKSTTYYYSANAALRIGNIFEQRKDYNRAANFYHQAIDMKDHEYAGSIENEAKEGLKRIGK